MKISVYFLLERLVEQIVQHPKRVILCTLLPCFLVGLFALRTPLDMSFTAMLDKEDPLLQQYLRVSDKIQFNSQLMLLIEGEREAELDAAVTAIQEGLQQLPEVRYVVSPVFNDWSFANLAWISTDAEFEELLLIGDHFNDPEKLRGLQKKLKERSTLPQNGARLLILGLYQDPLDVDIDSVVSGYSPYDIVVKETTRLLAPFDVQSGYDGLAALSHQDQSNTIASISRLTPLSLLLVLFILRTMEPRLRYVLSIGIPMILALVACLGLTGILLGRFTFVEGFFGIMVFGLGVDFGVHLLIRLREEHREGVDLPTAIKTTIKGTGPAIIAGGITTAGAFAIIAFAPDPIATHLGVSGAIGLLMCLVLMLTLLPALWLVFAKEGVPKENKALRFSKLERLSLHAVRHPKRWLFTTMLLCIIAIIGMPRFHFESNLENLIHRDVSARKVSWKIQELFSVYSNPWVVVTDTIAEAQQVQKAIEKDPLFARIEGVTSLFPADVKQREQRLLEAVPTLERQQQRLQTFAMGPPSFGLPAIEVLPIVQGLLHSAKQGFPSMESIPLGLRRQIMGTDGSYLLFVYGQESTLDARVLQQERKSLEAIHEQVSGMGVLGEAMLLAERPWLFPVGGGIFLFVCTVLFVALRSPKWIILAITPVCVGVLLTFGILCWLNVSFSIMTLLVLPLILGLGVDDGVHVVHRMRETPRIPVHKATISVIRGIVITTLTTCSSFAVLLMSDNTGLEAAAQTLLIALPICLLASLTLIPALAVLLGVSPKMDEGLIQESQSPTEY